MKIYIAAALVFAVGCLMGRMFEERAKFQTLQERLCMPVEVYSEAMAKFLQRPVWTREFASNNRERLMREVFDGARPPTFDEILRLIPQEKLVVLESEDGA
jgi:hypothetical protein